ncbi:hypothetical protein L1987_41023 [Smallanthus sonchifolius]|uniref:Uncharacterized protein n=1 Tax=Smallanthus sonchifolius TaxID=185202 RepID=A0ACB9GU08_9ASTR|nr:hypothetical protein L1987_41023 [Smallanthus sonchifolius]
MALKVCSYHRYLHLLSVDSNSGEIGSIRSRRRCYGGDIRNTQRLCPFSSYISRLGMLQRFGLVGKSCKERYNPHATHIMDPLPELY